MTRSQPQRNAIARDVRASHDFFGFTEATYRGIRRGVRRLTWARGACAPFMCPLANRL
jgi:hypothetical protein